MNTADPKVMARKIYLKAKERFQGRDTKHVLHGVKYALVNMLNELGCDYGYLEFSEVICKDDGVEE